MFEVVVDSALGTLVALAVLVICNKLVTWLAKGMSKEGVSGYEIHESFQERQARKIREKKLNG